jgi:hypothetical protein
MVFMKSHMHRLIFRTPHLAAVLFLFLLMPLAAHAESSAAFFTEGSARLSIHFGGATAFNQDYSIFGIGGGYFVADGVEIGLDAETWFGNTPRIEQVSPQVRVVLTPSGSIKPYVGAFYRRTHIEGYRDADTVGARAGAYFLTGGNAYFGAGLAQDIHLNCDRTVYTSCAETYPEFLFAVTF